MRLADVGELGLLAELERRGLARTIENDAAVVDGLVVTQDALVEGVHFLLDWLSWRDLGFRAAAVNLSDLAASGAEPSGLLVSFGAPSETRVEDVLELYEGIAETGVPVVGGDTTRADVLMLSVTALGRSDRVPGRGGAQPGDLLVVTGALGAAGAALPRADASSVRRCGSWRGASWPGRRGPSLDISDGLAADAGHIAARSGVRCAIDLEAVPLAAGATAEDLAFGEDYELLAATREPGGVRGDRTLRGGARRRDPPGRPASRPRRMGALPLTS